VSRVIAFILTLDVLICPLACGGSVHAAPRACGDKCCPSTERESSGDSPRPADDNCDASCKSCFCGGAVHGDENITNAWLTQDNLTHDSAVDLTFEIAVSARAIRPIGRCADNFAFPIGAALRAHLQSYLL
jgi:hypothetical protein